VELLFLEALHFHLFIFGEKRFLLERPELLVE
jgi:hypothetical protein